MAKDSGSPSKASSKSKRTKLKSDGLSSLDAPSSGGRNPPASASELKSLLKKSLEESAAGVANAAPDAESESPLLVRADIDAPAEKTRGLSKKKKSKPHTHEAVDNQPMSADSTPRDGGNSTSSEAQHHQHLRISGPRLNLSFGGCFGNNNSRACVPWGAGRLIQAMGTLRAPMQSFTTPSLSSLAQSQVQTLAPIAKKCWIELFVERSGELPFGVYSRPQVAVHLVDRFTGRTIHQTLTTSRAKINYACIYVNAFRWYHSLRFPITLVDFLSPQTLLLFELFEELKEEKKIKTRELNGIRFERLEQQSEFASRFQSQGRRRRIAWAFYSPVSEKGNVMLHTLSPLDDSSEAGGGDGVRAESCMRLQLFEYQILTWMDQYQAKAQWQWQATVNSGPNAIPAVFLQYQKRRWVVVPSTLYVDIRPIIPPVAAVSDLHTVSDTTLAQENSETEGDTASRPPEVDNNEELQTSPPASPSNNSPRRKMDPLQMDMLDPLVVCRRSPSEPCLVPHRVLSRLPTGKKGCSCVSFSPCGLLLAAAINQDSGEFLVHIYHVNLSQLVFVRRGHRGMIYSLEWDPKSSQRLISASSDGTARLWDVSTAQITGGMAGGTALCSWQHTPSPCFVYCGIFHPSNHEIALTGASDGLVRFWDTQSTSNSNQDGHGRELGRLRVSDAAVHSVCIEPKSGRLFCGDARGILTVWKFKSQSSAASTANSLAYELIKTIHTGQASITSLQVHPRKQHLLAHTQPNSILQYELRSYLLLNKSYTGVVCEKLLGKSSFSPDGRFVVSGSENGVPLLFASAQGQRFQKCIWGQPFFHQYPVTDVSWSPAAHIVALCSYGGSHPIVLLCAYRTDEDLAQHLVVAGANPTVSSLVSGAFTRELAQEKAAGSGAVSTGHDHSERVQRALERRRQRLQAKLALETEAVETTAHPSI